MNIPLLGTPSLSGFTLPWAFFLFLVPIGLAVLYVLAQFARRRRVLRFANMELLESVAPQRPKRFRHVPTILLVLSLVLFVIGIANPTLENRIPRNRAVVMLVIDVSQSMKADDVPPNRLEAAQVAAKQFAE